MPNEIAPSRSPQVFNFHEFPVRIISQGVEPWFVLPDLCRVLAIRNAASAKSPLDEDEKGIATVDTPGGPQQLSVISEPGLYRLLMVSRKPQAKAFQRWVTHEVLPAIRKTGAYSVEERLLERLLDHQERFFERLLERLPAVLGPLLTTHASSKFVNDAQRGALRRLAKKASRTGKATPIWHAMRDHFGFENHPHIFGSVPAARYDEVVTMLERPTPASRIIPFVPSNAKPLRPQEIADNLSQLLKQKITPWDIPSLLVVLPGYRRLENPPQYTTDDQNRIENHWRQPALAEPLRRLLLANVVLRDHEANRPGPDKPRKR